MSLNKQNTVTQKLQLNERMLLKKNYIPPLLFIMTLANNINGGPNHLQEGDADGGLVS